MYKCKIHSAPHQPAQQLVFGRSRVREKTVQDLLKHVTNGRGSVTCLCKGDHSPPLLNTYQRSYIALRRPTNTGSSHTPGCEHYDWSTSPFGMPAGSASESDGVLQINIDRLLWESEPNFGSGGGDSASHPRNCPPLLALLWLLIVRAGLNTYHASHHRPNPAAEVQFASESMRLAFSAGGNQPLSQRLLLPTWAKAERAAKSTNNHSILNRAIKDGRQLLYVAGLHKDAHLHSSPRGDFRGFSVDFGISLNMDEQILTRAFKTYTTAHRHFKAGGSLLALGIAEPRGRVTSAWTTKVALLSVHSISAAPTPTDDHKKIYDEAMLNGVFYSVQPSDDPLVARAATQKKTSASCIRGTPTPR